MSWAFRTRLNSFLRSSLWVVPALSTVVAVLSVPLLRILDKTVGLEFLQYTPDGARALASIVAAAMLSFVVLFFSVLLLTVQIASSSLTPRIISRLFRSRTLKASLGLFIFTLIYSMAVVARGTQGKIGQLTTATVIVLTIISICVFLYVVENVGKQLRPVTMMADIALDGLEVIKAVYPKKIEQDAVVEAGSCNPVLGSPSRVVLYSGTHGVIQALDIKALVDAASRAQCVIEVVPQVGDFVTVGDPIFRAYGADPAISSADLLKHVVLERERMLDQDPGFAFRIIVDIASKALSPAINDPTTAVLALDQIYNLLREVGLRQLDTGLVHDAAGRLRLVYRTPDWEDFVGLAVTEIRQYGATSTQVVRRMRAMFEDLIPLLPSQRARVLRQELELLESTVECGFSMPQDRKRAGCADLQGLGGHRKAA